MRRLPGDFAEGVFNVDLPAGVDDVGLPVLLGAGGTAGAAAAAFLLSAAALRHRRAAAAAKDGGPDAARAGDAWLFPCGHLLALVVGTAVFVALVVLLNSVLVPRTAVPLAPAPPRPPSHKDLMPWTGQDSVGFLLAVLGLLLASGGGIGGGGILVPLYILVFAFPDHRAIPLSNLTIFGGSIANCLQNWWCRHPWHRDPPSGKASVDRPLIDFDLVLAMEPLTIAGAILGSLLNKMLPGIAVTVMLVAVLGFTAYKTLRNAVAQWRRESGEGQPLLGVATAPAAAAPTPGAGAESPALRAILDAERRTPWDKISALVVLFFGCMLLNMLKGGPPVRLENPLWITCGGELYWFMLLLQVPWCLLFALLVRRMLLRQHQERVDAGYDCERLGQFVWNNKTTITYPLICSLAGLFAGLFGIGGGIVKGPLMIEMGVQAEVSSATAAFMIFFTASSATLSYALFGLVTPDYGALMFCVGFAATYVGQYMVKRAIRASGHPSIVVWVIGLTVAVSTVLMGYHGVATFETAANPWQLPPLCDTPVLYVEGNAQP